MLAPALPSDDVVASLAKIIAQYKQSDREPKGDAIAAAGGYAVAGAAGFLPPKDNAKRVDPNAAIGRHVTLDAIRLTTSRPNTPAKDLLGNLDVLGSMARLDALNPEISFLAGRIHMALAGRGRPGHWGPARKAFVDAMQKGRRAPSTVWLAVGAAAAQIDAQEGAQSSRGAAAGIELLDALEGELGAPDVRLGLLRVRLLRVRGQPGDEAQAKSLCASLEEPAEQAGLNTLWARTCAAGR